MQQLFIVMAEIHTPKWWGLYRNKTLDIRIVAAPDSATALETFWNLMRPYAQSANVQIGKPQVMGSLDSEKREGGILYAPPL